MEENSVFSSSKEKENETGDELGEQSQKVSAEGETVKAKKRDGHTRAHYNKQKGQSFSYFRINVSDLKKMDDFQFTIYDFINATFALSHTKKQLTIKVLDALKDKPMTFIDLHNQLGAKKSTLYLLCIALEKSGFIEKKEGKGEPYSISNNFSNLLVSYHKWWENWKQQ